MKKKFIQFYIIAVVMFSDFKSFAQGGPGDDDEGGGLEDDDAAPLPINGKLIWLAIAGILFAFYMYKRHRQISIRS